jgi:predicted acylesterase/phospholipase RssA
LVSANVFSFVCAIIDSAEEENEQLGPERLRTYDSKAGKASLCTIWEACRATSAAPLYFPSITIRGRTYWDGGMKSNNPAKEAYKEAKNECEGISPQILVSIGTGKPPRIDPGQNAWGMGKYLLTQLTNTEDVHKELLDMDELRDKYFRFNGDEQLYNIDMADWTQLDEVEEKAASFVTSSQDLIDKCARKLAKSRVAG